MKRGLLFWGLVIILTMPTVALAQEEEEDGFAWNWELFGYVRAGFEWVDNDPKLEFVGNNNGFILHNARFGIDGWHEHYGLSFRLSLEGATDMRDTIHSPSGDLDVRLYDVYLRRELVTPYVGLQLGQFTAPFNAEEIWSSRTRPFISRAVGLEGIGANRGYEQTGIRVDRQLGVMLSSLEPFYFGPFGLAYYLALMNGNGSNEMLNDNNALALAGRIELYWQDMVRLGGGVWLNDRTIGQLPNLYQENDLGISADLLVSLFGLELFAQMTTMNTEYPTVGTLARERLALHAQALYRFDQLPFVELAPAYRLAYYHPWSSGGESAEGINLETFKVMYHTIGLVVWLNDLPFRALVNYTITGEEEPRVIENNRLEAILQVDF